jgi:hypothetical protein
LLGSIRSSNARSGLVDATVQRSIPNRG